MVKKDDLDLDWAKEIEDVEPLKLNHKRHLPLSSFEVEDHDYENDVVEAIPLHMQPKSEKPKSINYDIPRNTEKFTYKSETAHLLVGAQPSISPDILKKLRKGLISIEGKLDLHGFKEGEAWQGLNDFLQVCFNQNKRCILLVHGKGKGYGEKGDMGIIKSNVCTWLEGSPFVLAYHTALGKHGGSGAVYVLIKRNKNV
jgi:DNA-nicking Smr family endonuclease